MNNKRQNKEFKSMNEWSPEPRKQSRNFQGSQRKMISCQKRTKTLQNRPMTMETKKKYERAKAKQQRK